MKMSLAGVCPTDAASLARLVREGIGRLEAIPGVAVVAAACCVPLESDWRTSIRLSAPSPSTREELRERLAAGELTDAEQKTLGQQLAQFAKAASVQDLLAATVRDTKLPLAARLTALGAMRDSKLKELPKNWSASLLAVP